MAMSASRKTAVITLLIASTARAQQLSGEWNDAACGASLATHPCAWIAAEKIDGGPRDDWQFDLTSLPGGARIGFAAVDVDGPSWTVHADRFSRAPSASDVTWVLGVVDDDLIALDSSSVGIGVLMGFTSFQLVGDSPSLPASAGIVLPTDGSQYSVPTGRGRRLFPMATNSGRLIAFAPLADLSDAGVDACTTGGAVGDPASGRGLVRGYNIFRSPGPASVPPPVEVMLDSWLDFVDLDTFDMNSFGPDRNRWDLAYFANPDALPYTGDEIVFYSDANAWPDGSPRVDGPLAGVGYWAIQAVLRGDVSDFANASLAGGPPADLRVDTNQDGIFDAVDLDQDGALEFYSPQAARGLPGLGVGGTHADPTCPRRPRRLIFSSGDFNQLPALGEIRAEARAERSDVVLTIDLANRAGDVVSLQASRRRGAACQVLTPGPIPVAGGEGSVVVLRDPGVLTAAPAPRRPTGAADGHLRRCASDSASLTYQGVRSGRLASRA
jgi:hypothetical protein